VSETSNQTGRAGRYQRSTGGLVGAMIISVAVIVAFVAFRAFFRDQPEVTPEPVDYLAAVAQAQDQGQRPVHPRELPAGWVATSATTTAGGSLSWSLGLLTAEGDFVGVRQEDASPGSLLATHVNEDVSDEGTVSTTSSVAREWAAYADDGGDHAYVAEVGGQTVLVYGSAPAAEIETFLGLLTR
jgi:hypothetical protein